MMHFLRLLLVVQLELNFIGLLAGEIHRGEANEQNDEQEREYL
jgi:hypothetical protein